MSHIGIEKNNVTYIEVAKLKNENSNEIIEMLKVSLF